MKTKEGENGGEKSAPEPMQPGGESNRLRKRIKRALTSPIGNKHKKQKAKLDAEISSRKSESDIAGLANGDGPQTPGKSRKK
eukprot:8750421-Pyramimonas_sp.AAC.1